MNKSANSHQPAAPISIPLAKKNMWRKMSKVKLPTDIYEPKAVSQTDPVLDVLKELNLALTRENYLEIAYPQGLPENWAAEGEASIPPQFRRICI